MCTPIQKVQYRMIWSTRSRLYVELEVHTTRPHALISKLSFDIHHSMHMCAEPQIDASYMVLPSPFNRDPENVAPRVRFLRPPMWSRPTIPWLEQNEQKTEFLLGKLGSDSGTRGRIRRPRDREVEMLRPKATPGKNKVHTCTKLYLPTHTTTTTTITTRWPSLPLHACVRVWNRRSSRVIRASTPVRSKPEPILSL